MKGFGMLALLLASSWMASSAPVAAQTSRQSARSPGISVQWNTAPAPTTAPPPSPQQGPASGSRHVSNMPAGGGDQFLAGPNTYAPRYDRLSRRRGGLGSGYGGPVGLWPPFGYSWAGTAPVGRPREHAEEPTGRLVLDVTPGSTQVYVDGSYRGTVDDVRERGLWLEAGTHRIELQADGAETTTFDVRIAVDETVNYRRDLSRDVARRVVEPGPPKSFYVIPRCYAGDTPPSSARLPAGCRLADVRVIPPVIAPDRRR